MPAGRCQCSGSFPVIQAAIFHFVSLFVIIYPDITAGRCFRHVVCHNNMVANLYYFMCRSVGIIESPLSAYLANAIPQLMHIAADITAFRAFFTIIGPGVLVFECLAASCTFVAIFRPVMALITKD